MTQVITIRSEHKKIIDALKEQGYTVQHTLKGGVDVGDISRDAICFDIIVTDDYDAIINININYEKLSLLCNGVTIRDMSTACGSIMGGFAKRPYVNIAGNIAFLEALSVFKSSLDTVISTIYNYLSNLNFIQYHYLNVNVSESNLLLHPSDTYHYSEDGNLLHQINATEFCLSILIDYYAV